MSLWKIQDSLGNPSRPERTMFLVSAYFDSASNRIFHQLIEGVARETGNGFMLENKVPPHITLSQVQTRAGAEQLISSMECYELEDMPVSIPVIFGAAGDGIPNVVYAKASLTDGLKDAVNRIFNRVCQVPGAKVSPFYVPEKIFPHVTLGKTLSRSQQKAAMDFLAERFESFSGNIVEIGLSSGKPPVDLWRIKI